MWSRWNVISPVKLTLWLCPRMTAASHCFQYLRHENQGERHYAELWREKVQEGVDFVKWYHSGALHTPYLWEWCQSSGTVGFYSWMYCWPLTRNICLLKTFLGQKLPKYPGRIVFWSTVKFIVWIEVQTVRKTWGKITLCHSSMQRYEFGFRLLSLKKQFINVLYKTAV